VDSTSKIVPPWRFTSSSTESSLPDFPIAGRQYVQPVPNKAA
jgi:hypothetical protein